MPKAASGEGVPALDPGTSSVRAVVYDTRSAAETGEMRSRFDERAYHARTGCFFHASYWPAKLRWLRATRRAAVRRTVRWISLGEYLYQQLHGEIRVSHSIASGTGLLDV